MATFAGTPKVVSSSGNVCAFGCSLFGFFVSAASATPTITVFDSVDAQQTNKVIDTFTPIAGTWYPMPIQLQKGLNIVIAGTVSATVVFG